MDNNKFKNHGKEKKGFTLIELIVVMAVVAILVLLAAPKFLNQTAKARNTQVKNDIKVAEQIIEEYILKHDSLSNSWEAKTVTELEGLMDQGRLIESLGAATSVLPGEYKVVDPTLISSNLKGDFFGNNQGKIYYDDETKIVVENEEPITEEPLLEIPQLTDYLTYNGDLFNNVANPSTGYTVGHLYGAFEVGEYDLLRETIDGGYSYEFIFDDAPETSSLTKIIIDIFNFYYVKTELLDEPYEVYIPSQNKTIYYKNKVKYTLYDRSLAEKGSKTFVHTDNTTIDSAIYDCANFYYSRLSETEFNITLGYYHVVAGEFAWTNDPAPFTFEYIIPSIDTSNPRVIDRTISSLYSSHYRSAFPEIIDSNKVSGRNYTRIFPSDISATSKTIRMYITKAGYIDIKYELLPIPIIGGPWYDYDKTKKMTIYSSDGTVLYSYTENTADIYPSYRITKSETSTTFQILKTYPDVFFATIEFLND